jgi:broad specificity phosphatase PhoE
LYVRHGTSEFNLERRFGGMTDTPLAAQGLVEARVAAKAATQLTIDCIVSSPLARCRRTAAIIADQIGYPAEQVIVNDLLRERSFGPLEGSPLRDEREIESVHGVESTDAVLDRAWLAHGWLSGLAASHVLVCGHGVFGRALRSTFHPERTFVTSAPQAERPAGIANAVITCWLRTCACCVYSEFDTF